MTESTERATLVARVHPHTIRQRREALRARPGQDVLVDAPDSGGTDPVPGR